MMRVVLYNDTSLINSHFGPQLVVATVRDQLARRGSELIGSLHRDALPADNRKLLSRADLVIVNGEGSIHHGRCPHLIDLAKDFPAVLINCVFQENLSNPALARFRIVTARESLSAAHLLQCGAVAVDIVPDLMFATPLLVNWQRGSESKNDMGLTDNVTNRESGFSPFVDHAVEYLDWLASHRRVVCGRYHAAVACCVLGIPFTCWASNTWKIEGMLADMELPELCHATQEAAIRHCPASFDAATAGKVQNYVQRARQSIETHFDAICASGGADAVRHSATDRELRRTA